MQEEFVIRMVEFTSFITTYYICYATIVVRESIYAYAIVLPFDALTIIDSLEMEQRVQPSSRQSILCTGHIVNVVY